MRDADAPREDRDAFLEEFIVRRELAVNFVRFNPRYDSLDGCEPWARRTLEAHAADRREPRYSLARLEAADTHDPLWNAAQIADGRDRLDARLRADVLGEEDPRVDARPRGGLRPSPCC